MNDKPLGFPAELQSLLDALPEPRVLIDLNYRILSVNAAYRNAFGDSQANLGRTCYEVSHHFDKPCDQCGESCPLQAALKTLQPSRLLHLHYTPRGQEYVDVELIPILNEQRKPVYFIETMRFLHEKSVQPVALGMEGRSTALSRMLALLNRAAPAITPVLLLGESGTGKELAAQAVHRLSPRRNKPFVPVDCSGLSEGLFEAELFGYEKGAFTGANQRKAGLVEASNGGTLFLDELGDIPLHLQVKLLRLLESGTFRRVGGVEILHANFRLVAATHRNLAEMMEAGTFRRDLYYRISAFPIHLPALRERRDDLPLLTETLLKRLMPGRALHLSEAAMARLMQYDFPGNVRELRNILERAILLADGDTIDVAHLPVLLDSEMETPALQPVADQEIVSLDEAERLYVRRALRQLGGNKQELARRLGVSERTLYRKLG